MFFTGQLSAAPTVAKLQADIIALVTGAVTDVAGLSDNFVAGTTRIVNTIAPGWQLLDSAAGAVVNGVTPKVIGAPWTDDATKFKCLKMGADVAANQINYAGYEAWNASTHVGTNGMGATPTSLYWMCNLLSANGQVVISATPAHLFIAIFTLATYGNTPHFMWISEYAREDAWNTVANGYPSWFMNGSYASDGNFNKSNLMLPRILNTTGTPADAVSVSGQDTATVTTGQKFKILPQTFQYTPTDGIGVGLEAIGRFNMGSGANTANAAKASAYALSPLRLATWASSATYGANQMGSITAKNPQIMAFRNVWASGDEFDADGVRWFVANMGSTTHAIAIREE